MYAFRKSLQNVGSEELCLMIRTYSGLL